MKVYVSTIVKDDNKVLLVQEGKQSCYGKWNFPSGHLEEDEDILAGALREVNEETGLSAELLKLVGIYNNQYEGNNSIQFSFLASAKDISDLSFDHQEILDAAWIEMDKISSYDLRDASYIHDALDRVKNENTVALDTFVIR